VTREILISTQIHQFLIDEFSSEVSHGLPRLKKIPDTSVQGFLLYFSELEPMDQRALIEVLTRRSIHFFFPQDAASIYSETDGDLHYQRYHDAWRERPEMRPEGARALKTIASLWKKGLFPPGVPAPPSGYLEMAESIEPARAAQIRKSVKNLFAQIGIGQVENLGGGEWLYEGQIGTSPVAVTIDYGGMTAQLRYEVDLDCSSRALSFKGISFERLLGVGLGDWDLLTVNNLDEKVRLLGDLVAYIAALPERLPISYVQGG
jgi:hypothetical protein